MLIPRFFLLVAEPCEDPDHHSEIHPAGDSAAQSQPMSSPLSLQYIDVFVLCAVFYVSCLIVLRTISTTERDGVLFFVIVRSEFPTTSQSGNQGRSAMLVQAANAAGK
jgi:hypothetical protein